MTTTIQKWGNSQGIRLPKFLLDSINWSENEKLEVKTENEKIIIEKMTNPSRKNIKELFADFQDEYEPIDINWGSQVGKEIW